MISEQDIHIGQTLCVLCRQAATVGSHVLDLNQKLRTVPDCSSSCARCSQSPCPMVWFHAACYDVLQHSYEPSKKPTPEDLRRFADATRPVYKCQYKEHMETMSVMEGLFSKYTREIIQDGFKDLLGQLPVEIITMISDLIAPCWYLTVLGETRRLIELLRDRDGTQSKQLSLKPEMWMSRIKYRGTSYVAQLSGKPLESTSASEQCHIKLPRNISKIILSVDCIGIRGIQFIDHKSNPISDGSPWYEILDAGDTDLEVYVSCDGLFMRGIQLASSSLSTYRAWSSPFPPKFHPWNFYQARCKSRLDYLKFDSHIRGLLVCCANAKTVGIHGFSDVSKAFTEFIDLMNRRTSNSYKHWIYFPFNGHEYIKAAWIRKFRICRGSASDPILVLQTSLGRTITFGPQFPAQLIDQYEYHPLVRGGDGAVSGIFHDGLDPATKYISEIGVTCNNQYDVGPPESPPMDTRFEPPAVPPGRGSIASTWYMTKASLKGLVKLHVCRDKEQPHCPCLGLLLFYSDEHIESIGQVRWDHDLSQETVRPMYIENGVVDGRDYIKDIRSGIYDTELNVERSGFQKLPEHGIIVWWFSQLGDRIITYNS
ncbi:uncharacterized protein BDW43DRAFT_304532 [Aspergillus alliaceus]|uniref:uncharacterized protein n=1 Tax=Petromyces alliaceus TaxID=209559 RepID=UPI0012A51B3A|nr:uncharacterized protein BDW43DRAFT_304532 [Aspergillus alliaceus]KAB8227557.1 hypothetical protein BDW43DRAFT_304532 [Aspergillus alliaceus]